MSLKRGPTSDINHDNWDKEDPSASEKMGTFTTASKDTLEKRVMRTAKRRFPGEEKKNAFSEFAGFNKPQPTSFDFLANLTKGSTSTNGASTKSDTAVTSSLFSSKPTTTASGGLFGMSSSSSSKPTFGATQQTPFPSTETKSEIQSMTFSSSKADSTVGDSPFKIQPVSSSADSNAKSQAQVSSTIFGVTSTSTNQNKSLSNAAFKQPESSTTAVQNSSTTQLNSNKNEAMDVEKDVETDIEKARKKYYSRLKGLNESVSSWIVKHVEKTPLCFLSPIFKDYENYLKEIQEEYEAAKAKIKAKTEQETSEVKHAFGFKDGGASEKPPVTQLAKQTNQTFGMNATTGGNTNAPANTGLFGQTSPSGISQSTSKTTETTKGFSFGVTSTTPATNTNSSLFTTNADNTSALPSQGFSFGMKTATATTSENPVSPPSKGFSFGVTSTPSATNSPFATTSPVSTVSPPSKGFSFGVTSTPSTTNSPFATTSPANTVSPPSKGFSFGVASTAATPPKTTSPFASSSAANTGSPVKGFSFGMTSTPTTASPTNLLTNSATGAAPFSFGIGSGKPFSFNSQIQKQSTETQKEDEEDQPPKVEYTPVVEENSVFDKKCKIFVKKDGNFVDKGVGTLYVKKIVESGKHQLLVRANTNLGTVLLNIVLTSAVPTQRTGKNNVMLVCIPTPDADPPPTPVLIRVKTGEEADKLLEILNKYKS